MFAIVAKTPAAVTGTILAGLRDQCPHAAEPVRLRVQSHPTAVPGRCYAAVAAHLDDLPREVTGEMVFGWLIWEQPGVFLVFEHHAVAKVADSLVDVARHLDGEQVVIFAPDPTATVPFGEPECNPVAGTNRYYALSNSPLVQRIVDLKRMNDRLAKSLMLAGKTHEQIFHNWQWKRNDDEVYRLFLLLARRVKEKSNGRRR